MPQDSGQLERTTSIKQKSTLSEHVVLVSLKVNSGSSSQISGGNDPGSPHGAKHVAQNPATKVLPLRPMRANMHAVARFGWCSRNTAT